MRIEAVRVRKDVRSSASIAFARPVSENIDYMVNKPEGAHDDLIAGLLAVASVYAYSDIYTFAETMVETGLGGGAEIVGIANAIPEMFVDTNAYLIQTADKRLAVLSIRGTRMTNISNWFGDASIASVMYTTSSFVETFAGRIHGGFLQIASVMMPSIYRMLKYALKGYSICAGAVRENAKFQDCVTEASWRGEMNRPGTEREEEPGVAGHLPPLPPENAPNKLEALYITGHSLGGALAVLMAATLRWPLSEKLRGIYTYGQPMVGDKRTAERYQPKFGHKLYRHIYGVDVIPRLPPLTMGRFVHFGKEFASSHRGWVPRSGAVTPVCTGTGAAVLGLFGLLQEQLIGVPSLQRLPLPYSLADHKPLNYLYMSWADFVVGAAVPMIG
ncbi:lipase family protein [Sorangium atrum]|uniref:Lipase family protein n=1 Tax=Sorangium atrum TaxID=2995308 RepID=A0ABT5C5L5_9BACT|nr:lipase family protein [Sorangium aterium]MDC0681716.1 lipase family protein [Sorangium aterium]